MNGRRDLLNKLKANDRIAVALLRGGRATRISDAGIDAFSALRERLTSDGHVLLAQEAPMVSPSELLVLGWLAAFQRDRLEPAIQMKRVHLPEAEQCAQIFDRAGYRLDYRHVVRLTEDRSGPASWSLPSPSPDTMAETSQRMPGEAIRRVSMLRHRIVRLLAENGPMTMADLSLLGASRQTVSNLAKRGLVKRLRVGVYAAADGKTA